MDILRKLFRKKRSMLSALIAAFTMLLLSSSATAASAPNAAESIPYATFQNTNGEGLLTLYCGKPEGDYIELNTDGDYNLLYNTRCNVSKVKKVTITKSFKAFRPTTTANWFSEFFSLETIEGIGNINTAEVTDMQMMFVGCPILKSLDMSGFNTDEVTYMKYMFYSCPSLQSLNLSSFNTEKVEDMSWMFSDCKNLKTIYVSSKWNTDKVFIYNGMFDGCTALTGGAGTGYDKNNIDITYARIDGEGNPGYLTKYIIPYATFDATEGLLTISYGEPEGDYIKLYTDGDNNLLYGTTCKASAVEKVTITESFKDFKPATTASWFFDFTSLETIEGIGNITTDEVTNMDCMFFLCQSLQSLNLSGFNTSGVTNMHSMFDNCQHLLSLDLSSFNTEKVEDMAAMFYQCNKLENITLGKGFNTTNVTNMLGMFSYCQSLTSLDISRFSTANVTDMREMFLDCSSLATIYVSSKWNTDKVYESYSYNMFSGCTALTGGAGTGYNENHTDINYARIDGEGNRGYLTLYTIPYATFDATDGLLTLSYGEPEGDYIELYTYEFENLLRGTTCKAENVKEVVITKSFKDFKPTTTDSWFKNFTKLETIEGIGNITTDEVTYMDNMFNNCYSLKSLDLSSFNTENVTVMQAMFFGCKSLQSLNLSSFNTEKVEDMFRMFFLCENLETIYVSSKWNTDKVSTSTNMFLGCAALVGGEGTTYNENNTDKTYARIDGGESAPGYLTTAIAMSSCEISLTEAGHTYTGSEITPPVTVAYSGRTLKENNCYTVAYADNINAGTATVTITGKGNYNGSVT